MYHFPWSEEMIRVLVEVERNTNNVMENKLSLLRYMRKAHSLCYTI